MSTFVDACRKEWGRLGVPEAVANEMAGDLEADLAEADADGVSPEEVLGNGFFDPEAFAASWASARGVVEAVPSDRGPNRWRPWVMAASTAVSVIAVLLGMALLVGIRSSSMSVSGVAFRKPFLPQFPSMFIDPHRVVLIAGERRARPDRAGPPPRRTRRARRPALDLEAVVGPSERRCIRP